jgi:hypothetical protein
LHVLGTPPALILSQDQTLQLKPEPSKKPVRISTEAHELKRYDWSSG